MSGSQIVANVLLSRAAQKIDFYLGGIHVDGEGLKEVVSLVHTRLFLNYGVGVVRKDPEPGVGASYNEGSNTISFPTDPNFGYTGVTRMHVVHESIHVMHDIYANRVWSQRGSKFTTRSENEAAAYLGGALFTLYDTGAVFGGPIFNEAFIIAKAIENKKGIHVPDGLATLLRTSIVLHPQYIKDGVGFWMPTTGDGV